MSQFSLFSDYRKKCKRSGTTPISKKAFKLIENEMKKFALVNRTAISYASAIDKNWSYLVVKENDQVKPSVVLSAIVEGLIKSKGDNDKLT